jgi:hypothetical protein
MTNIMHKIKGLSNMVKALGIGLAASATSTYAFPTPTEKAFIAATRYLLANGLADACDAAAREFLAAAPTLKAGRRRAHALLRLVAEERN